MPPNNWSYIRALFKAAEEQGYWPVESKPDDPWPKDVFQKFPGLLDFVSEQGGQALNLKRQDLAIILALIALGPDVAGDPPAHIWRKLCNRVEDEIPDGDARRWLEVVVAWGCGWGRLSQPSGLAWEGRWEKAILVLSSMIRVSVRQTFKLLGERGFASISSEEIEAESGLVALRIVHNKCACGHHERGCKERNGIYACGKECCLEKHWLLKWQLGSGMSLQGFIAQAIRGSATPNFQSGAFVSSIVCAYLEKNSGLRVGVAEFKQCHVCQKLYEGTVCRCSVPFELYLTARRARKNWLFIPHSSGGTYQQEERWRCRKQECDNLYPVGLTNCPLCRSARPQRRTTVWIRRRGLLEQEHFELEDERMAKDTLDAKWALLDEIIDREEEK